MGSVCRELRLQGGTHCQSVCMCPRCRSPERKATWQVLHVNGWVDCTEGAAAWDAMFSAGLYRKSFCGGILRGRKRCLRAWVGWIMEIPSGVGGQKGRADRASGCKQTGEEIFGRARQGLDLASQQVCLCRRRFGRWLGPAAMCTSPKAPSVVIRMVTFFASTPLSGGQSMAGCCCC